MNKIKLNHLTPPETVPFLLRYLPLGEVTYSYSPRRIMPSNFFNKIKELTDYLDKNGFIKFGNQDKSKELKWIYSWNNVFNVHSLEDDHIIVKIRDFEETEILSKKIKIPRGSVLIHSEPYGSQRRFLTLKRKAISALESITGNKLTETSISNKRGETVEWYA